MRADTHGMGMTHTQRRKVATKAETAGIIVGDQSEVLHTFDDGWTIARLATVGDVRREGVLMRSCLAKYAGDTLHEDPKKLGEFTPGERADDEPFEKVHWRLMMDTDLSGRHVGCILVSLRDPANLPHATWWQDERGDYVCGVAGFRNDKLSPAYAARVDAWIEQAKIKWVEGRKDVSFWLNYRDGQWIYEGMILERYVYSVHDRFGLGAGWEERPMGAKRRVRLKAFRQQSLRLMMATLSGWGALVGNYKYIVHQKELLEKATDDAKRVEIKRNIADTRESNKHIGRQILDRERRLIAMCKQVLPDPDKDWARRFPQSRRRRGRAACSVTRMKRRRRK